VIHPILDILLRYICQPPNGLRYLRVGGRGLCLGTEKNSKPEKCLKMPQNPTRQVHALLGGFMTLRIYAMEV